MSFWIIIITIIKFHLREYLDFTPREYSTIAIYFAVSLRKRIENWSWEKQKWKKMTNYKNYNLGLSAGVTFTFLMMDQSAPT